jgi:hypothetical protein
MKLKVIATLSVAALLVSASMAGWYGGVASAVSPSQQECEDAGGTFDRTQGTVSCTFESSEPVGNSGNSGGKSQTVDSTEEESSKGTLKNQPQHEESSECTGPGQGNSTAQCP